jgi:hypothetical protein
VKPFISLVADYLQREEATSEADRTVMLSLICDDWAKCDRDAHPVDEVHAFAQVALGGDCEAE